MDKISFFQKEHFLFIDFIVVEGGGGCLLKLAENVHVAKLSMWTAANQSHIIY